MIFSTKKRFHCSSYIYAIIKTKGGNYVRVMSTLDRVVNTEDELSSVARTPYPAAVYLLKTIHKVEALKQKHFQKSIIEKMDSLTK